MTSCPKGMITIRMPKDDLAVVLATLRMPENQGKQGRGALFSTEGYCCLGAMQYAKSGGIEYSKDIYGNAAVSYGLPSGEWLQSVGWEFYSRYGGPTIAPYLPTLRLTADSANDSGEYTFAQIADAIEACAEGY